MKKISLLYLALLSLIACNGNLESVSKTNDYNHQLTYTINKETGKKEGRYVAKTADGVLLEEAVYKADTLDGTRKIYNEAGKLEIVETYKNGLFHGPNQVFYGSGQLKFDGHYTNNILTGETKSYYENGQLKEVVQFDNNLENGPFVEYHPNGKIKAKGTYLDGDNEHGELEIFDESGELIKKMDCKKGVCRTTWEKQEGSTKIENI